MNKKLKEQLELVIMQCSALKAALDESLVRNKQYENEIANLRRKLEVAENIADTTPQEEATIVKVPAEVIAEPATELAEPENTPAEEIAEPTAETASKEPMAEEIAEQPTQAAETPNEQTTPVAEPETEMQNFQNTLEIGADMVSQAVASSKEYIARLEAAHPEGCSSLTDIIRSRTDLFKVEISGIIGGVGSLTEKREKMSSALIKLIQYFENVK